MRTTLNLNDALAAEVKARALAEGSTMTSFIEEALRDRLARVTAPTSAPLPTYGTPGRAAFLIDITDRDALRDAMDAGDGT